MGKKRIDRPSRIPRGESAVVPSGRRKGATSVGGSTVTREGRRGSRGARRRSDFIVGTSPALTRVLDLIVVVARTDFPVLISGETGTGKELVARAVHYSGSRAGKPFITVNCGAIPETLMEDELFGHARGAFTGAQSEKKGVFEEADKGSIFLDEIGELPSSCQVKLLRVLQEREVKRLGETKVRKINVRVIAATNKDLQTEMKTRRFREDLYHRINVLPISLPPLRKRREDIHLLVDHFVRQYNQEFCKAIRGFTQRALTRLKSHSWPGNVRELENRVKRAMVFAEGEIVDVESLDLSSNRTVEVKLPSFRKAKEEFEKNYLVQSLRLTDGNVAAAARLAEKDRKDFYDLMKKHGINPDDFRK